MPEDKKITRPGQFTLAKEIFIISLKQGMDMDCIDEQDAAMADAMELAEEFYLRYFSKYKRPKSVRK